MSDYCEISELLGASITQKAIKKTTGLVSKKKSQTFNSGNASTQMGG